MTRETKSNHGEGSSTSTSNRKTRRCYECEIIFQPGSHTERFCSDCSKGVRPFANYNVDHLYIKNVPSAPDEVVIKSSGAGGMKHDQPQLNKRQKICEKETKKVERIRLNPGECQKLAGVNVGSNLNKNELSATHFIETAAKNILNISFNANIKKQINHLPNSQISAKRWNQGVDFQNSLAGDTLVALCADDKTELVKWNHRVIDSEGDPAVSPINNFQLVPSNPKSGCTRFELNALRAEEEELEKLISSYSSDFDQVLSVHNRIRLIELKSKRLTEEELLASKEYLIKSLERQSSQTQCLVEACKEERDSLSNIAKESENALELARSQTVAAEKSVNEAKQKFSAAKDGDFKNYLRNALAVKEKRAASATKESDLAVSQLEKAKQDFKDAEEDLETKIAAYQQALEQTEKTKSELMVLRDNRASDDMELNFYYSYLKSHTENNENFRRLFELKKKMLDIKFQIEREEFLRNLEIKYDRIREELYLE